MSTPVKKEEDTVVARECRFAVFCPPPDRDGQTDLHVVKEIVHHADGTTSPNLRFIYNYKRPFWITNKGMRNHKQKKEWESLENVRRHECTQSQLVRAVTRAIGKPWLDNGRGDMRKIMRKIARDPYIYGTDILSTAIIKRYYQDRYPDHITPYTAAMYDTETDVIRGTEEIIMGTLSFQKRVFTAIAKVYLEQKLADGIDVLAELHKKLHHYLGPYVEKRQIEWEVIIVDHEYQIVEECFKRAHAWQPDWVAVWNIDFDMQKSIRALEKAGIHPKDVFSDPRVPKHFRHFRYKQGSNQKVTASGKVTPIKPAAQWHTVYCPASFYFIDAMCAYKHIRTGKQEEPSYSLDAILDKHLGIRKLKFEEAEGLVKLDWHKFMQEKYPLEYVIYNVFDCVSMEELDEKTNDLRYQLPLFSGHSDFEHFRSQPRRLVDDLHYFVMNAGYVIASTSDEMADDYDEETIGLDGWIVTLPAHLVVDNGLQVILENHNLRTNIRAHVADLDVSASYPNGGAVFNISKETTHRELIEIEGVAEIDQRMEGINLSGGHTNAVEFCTTLYKLPTFDELLAEFEVDMDLPLDTMSITHDIRQREKQAA